MSCNESKVDAQIQPALNPLDDWGKLWNCMLDERQELCAAIIRQSAAADVMKDSTETDVESHPDPRTMSSFDGRPLFDQLAYVDEHLDRLFEASRCLEFHSVFGEIAI